MVALSRLQWIFSQLTLGRQARISTNSYDDKTVIHVTLAPLGSFCDNSITAAILQSITSSLHLFLVVDRGHQHTSGVSRITLTFRPRETVSSKPVVLDPAVVVPASSASVLDVVQVPDDGSMCASSAITNIATIEAELCNTILKRLEPALAVVQQRRDQIETLHSQWQSVPASAQVLAPVVAMRGKMLELMEEQIQIEERLASEVKGMVKDYAGGAAVLAAVRSRCCVALIPDD